MPRGNYASTIDGIRFLKKRELPPVSTAWDYQTAERFPVESAQRLFEDLPEDCEISFFDPAAEKEEAWILVRRVGQRYSVQRLRHGSSPPWSEEALVSIVDAFSSSPLVQEPSDSFESFTVSSIPDHQKHEHTDGKA